MRKLSLIPLTLAGRSGRLPSVNIAAAAQHVVLADKVPVLVTLGGDPLQSKGGGNSLQTLDDDDDEDCDTGDDDEDDPTSIPPLPR